MNEIPVSLSIARWLLLGLLSLWTLALLGIAFLLYTDSYGGMGPIPLFIAMGNGFAAVPFLTPTGSTFLFLARGMAVGQGAALIATCFLVDGMANTIVSMGNSKGASASPLTIFGTLAGLGIIGLALIAPPCLSRTPLPPG